MFSRAPPYFAHDWVSVFSRHSGDRRSLSRGLPTIAQYALYVGAGLGSAVGAGVGRAVGVGDGRVEGASVGSGDGRFDGTGVGSGDGWGEGWCEGAGVGAPVGFVVGTSSHFPRPLFFSPRVHVLLKPVHCTTPLPSPPFWSQSSSSQHMLPMGHFGHLPPPHPNCSFGLQSVSLPLMALSLQLVLLGASVGRGVGV